MSKEENANRLPRREFLKYSSIFTAGAAYAVYITTDAKGEATMSAKALGAGSGFDGYGYLDP